MAIQNYSDNIIIVDLPAEPNIRVELENLRGVLQTCADSDVIIDFSQVDIITSLSLSGFLMVRELLAKAGRRLVFCNISPITRDIFTVTCFDGIFEFIDDKDHAVQALTNPQPCEQPTE